MNDLDSRQNNARHVISAPSAYALLIREFTALKSAECACRVSLPFWGPAPNNQTYWYMPAPKVCAYGCDRILLELWARFTTDYRIAPPGKEKVSWIGGVRVPEPHG